MNNLNYIFFFGLLLISVSSYAQKNSNIIATPSTKYTEGTPSLQKAGPINNTVVTEGKTSTKNKKTFKTTRKLKLSDGVPYLVLGNGSDSSSSKEKIAKSSTHKMARKETKNLTNPSLGKLE